MSDLIPFKTVASHNRPGDAWIVINESVYDISSFPHPGGLQVLEPYLGRDATAAFLSQHNLDMLAIVEKNLVGVIDRDERNGNRSARRQKIGPPTTAFWRGAQSVRRFPTFLTLEIWQRSRNRS